jgi:hypothetical protein
MISEAVALGDKDGEAVAVAETVEVVMGLLGRLAVPDGDPVVDGEGLEERLVLTLEPEGGVELGDPVLPERPGGHVQRDTGANATREGRSGCGLGVHQACTPRCQAHGRGQEGGGGLPH